MKTGEEAVWDAWCDGSAAPNPGRIGVGVLLISPAGERHEMSALLSASGCNNEAELHALSTALNFAARMGIRRLHIRSDSRFVVDCLNGLDTTEIPRLKTLLSRAQQQLESFAAWRLQWLPHRRNTMADRLARAAHGLPERRADQSKKIHRKSRQRR